MNPLFTPCRFGPLSLKNHLALLPFFTAYADENGLVTPQILRHYQRMAASGAGLVIVEASTPRDRILNPFTLRAFAPEHLPGLRRLAETIKAEGAAAVLQLCHSGRFSGRPGALAPSPVPAFGVPDLMPAQMDENDMAAVAEAFAESAALIREAGFDGVELHGGTGYLLASYTSPRTNIRGDRFGGSVENRLRFPLDVCRAVRRRVGDFPVGYRLMIREYLPGGLGLEEGLAFAKALETELDPAYLSVTAGTHECLAMLAEQKIKLQPGYMLPEADAVKAVVPDVPVIAAGLLQTPELCLQALTKGMADGIGLGRVFLADPDWPAKAAGANPKPIRECVQCNTCGRQAATASPVYCSRWSQEEKALFLADLSPDRLRKTVKIRDKGEAPPA